MQETEFDERLFRSLIQGVKDYAIFALNTEGHIMTWNAGAERAKGYKANEIIGKHFSIFYPQADIDRGHPAFELAEALKNGSYEEEGLRLRKDGSLFQAHVTITAIHDDAGAHIGFTKVTRDLTERTIQGQKLEASEKAFEHMVAAVKDYAIFRLDTNGFVQSWNAGAQRIKGYITNEIIGKHFSIFYADDPSSKEHTDFELQEAAEKGSYNEEGWRYRKDGTKFWADVTITAVRDANNLLTGFLKVTKDMTETKRIESELEEARDEAVLANQLKTKLVANITHEIRTPLGGIIGLSELIADSDNSPEEIKDSGARIFTASKQLLALLNDLLDFSRLEAGKTEIIKQPFSIRAVIDDACGLVKLDAEDKGLKITSDVSPDVPELLIADATKVRQILLNLLNNSIKFTVSGGIEISATTIDDFVEISVTDTGLGVPEDKQALLFRPFTQGHDPSFGGTGLGLSICQQFIEMMGGNIGMVSAPNEGTTVWFTIPLTKDGQ